MKFARFIMTALFLTSSMLHAQQAPSDSTTPADWYGWTVRTFTADEIGQHPARDLRALISLMPGLVALDADGGLYGRGSRNGQIEYRVNGIDLTDRFANGFSFPFIPEAFEEVSAHVGPYGALLGAAPGGLVDMRLRRGGVRWSVTAQHLTDDFAPTGSTFLGTSSFGQHTSVITAGGPLPFDTRLFVAAEIHRMRDRDPRWVEPFSYTLERASFTPPYGGPFPAPFEFKKNHHLSNSLARSCLVWNLTTTPLGIEAAFWGIAASSRTRDASEYRMLHSYYQQQRIPWWDDDRSTIGLSIGGTIGGTTRLHGSVVRMAARSHTSDPDFGEDWRLYADSAANAAMGYSGFVGRYSPNVTGYFTDDYLGFRNSNYPNLSYVEQAISGWKVVGDVEAEISKGWTLATRFEREWWTLRSFDLSNVAGARMILDPDQDGVDDRVFSSDREREYYYSYVLTSYGYDVNGEPVDDDLWHAARHPFRTAVALSSRWEDGPLDLELSIRGIWDNTNVPTPRPGGLPGGLWPAFPYDNQYQLVEPSALGPAATTEHWLPRFSATYRETDLEVHAAWGKFLSALPFEVLHSTDSNPRSLLGPYRQSMWDASAVVLTSSARPEIASATEIGANWQVLPNLWIGMTVFAKDMPSQVQLGFVPVDTMALSPTAFVNTGESRSKGGEVTLVAKPSPLVRLRLSYAYQDIQGMGATPRSNFVQVSDVPIAAAQQPYDLDYELTHRILGEAQLTGKPGTWLESFDLWLMGRAASGHPYTRFGLPSSSNLAPWYGTMGWALYPQHSLQAEPRNASRTPWTFIIDLSASYRFTVGPAWIRASLAVTNALNTKEVINVFPASGSPTEDGWLRSELGRRWIEFSTTGMYEQLYTDLVLRNRHAYLRYAGQDIYARPRQLRLGVEVGL